jgi:hypothetical protein
MQITGGAGGGGARGGSGGASGGTTGGSGASGTTGGSGTGGTTGGSSGGTTGGSNAGTTGGSGTGGSGTGGTGGPASGPGSGTWRPFSNDSPWNTKIPANPEIDPDSAAMINDFATSSPYGQKVDINMKQFTVPMYYADASTPRVLVRADIGGLGFTGGNDGANATAMVPIPADAAPDPQTDGHMLIIDRVNLVEWGFFVARKDGAGWRCALCASMNLNSNGVRPFKPTNPTWYTSHGSRACGFPLVAGLIRAESVRAGRIDHALHIAYPHIRAGLYTSPATTAQSRIGDQAIKSRGIPCGGHIQLDPALNLDTLPLSAGGKVVARALQEYGAFVGDFSGGISLTADDSPAARAMFAGVLDDYDLAMIDPHRFRVLKLGQLTDDGNGD